MYIHVHEQPGRPALRTTGTASAEALPAPSERLRSVHPLRMDPRRALASRAATQERAPHQEASGSGPALPASDAPAMRMPASRTPLDLSSPNSDRSC